MAFLGKKFAYFLTLFTVFFFVGCSLKTVKDRRPARERPLETLYDEASYSLDKTHFTIDASSQMATSKILKTPFSSNFIGVYWPHPKDFQYDHNFLIRSSVDGKRWSRWKDIFLMDDGPDGEEEHFKYSHLVYTQAANYFQFKIVRVNLSETEFDGFIFTFFDSRLPQRSPTQERPEEGDRTRMITRAEWGADEEISWRKESPQPQPFVKHLVIHHSALNNNISHEKCYEAVRAYQTFHINVRGWSDIGYQYLVCQHGYLFQGRRLAEGGQDVIGAHAKFYNKGSLGVCAIGLYMDTTHLNEEEKSKFVREMTEAGELWDKNQEELNIEPSSALREGMVQFLTEKARYYNLDPRGSYEYTPGGENSTPQNLSSILGHQDVKATLCPGNNLYRLIPNFKEEIAGRLEKHP